LKAGKWYPVAERLSRWARIRLLEILLDELEQKEIARACDTSEQAVSNWAHKKTHHPSDKNAVALLNMAWQRDRDRTREILRTEAERYLKELRELGIRP
jgi:hypothetical protein